LQECYFYKLISLQNVDQVGFNKSRVVLRDGKLVSIISDGEIHDSGAADLSPSIRIDALQF